MRFHAAWHLVAAARFKQQHAGIPVLGQPTRHGRSGRPWAADDEVV